MTDAAPRAGALRVGFVGEVHRVDPDEQFTFGRTGDLVVDENRHLHRIMGSFYNDAGIWWLRNEGSALRLHLVDRDSRSSATISPGTAVALSFPRAMVRFAAGGCDYEIEIDCEDVTGPVPVVKIPDDDTTFTVGPNSVPLTDDQRLALLVMAEPALRNPHQPVAVPSNAEMAHRIGWTLRRFNRKVDNLCEKFGRAGIPGLRGSVSRLATDRRQRLVEHCVQAGVLTVSDLDTLSQHIVEER